MSKKINIYSSHNTPLAPFSCLFADLSQHDYSFEYFTNGQNKLYDFFGEQNWHRRITTFGPSLKKKSDWWKFIFTWKFLMLRQFWHWWLGKQDRPKTIICLGLNEKLFVTPIAKLFKIKTIWIELPKPVLIKTAIRYYKFLSRYATVIALNQNSKKQLVALGLNDEAIRVIQPGIKLQQFTQQDDLFHNLADSTHANKKFFTIGTVTNLNEHQKIESLFQAIKKCLSIIPNIQLVIVGDGKEKKNLLWLAKKMEIDNLVWLVGKQQHLRKWIDNFDIYITSDDKLTLSELIITLNAMAAEKPTIGNANSGLEDIIYEGKTGYLVDLNDSEAVADKILLLHQDKDLRRTLGKKAFERVEKYFTSAKMLEQLEKLL